jgi:hypothetical protein
MFDKIYNPILFQGSLRKKNYFEGWYYKMVSADGACSVALIPGISLNKEHSHAFVQVFVTHNGNLKTIYAEFDKSNFTAINQPFTLSIEDNTFTEHGCKVSILHKDLSIDGKLKFSGNTKIETTLLSPSIMGFFSYFTFMECYHGVVSMNHLLAGELIIDGKTINFNGGKGYIEKDWGRSFPREYVWMQSNHFNNDGTSFMFSEAIIPFAGFFFNGLIINLVINKKEYRFATYNGAKVNAKEVKSNSVKYEIIKGELKLIVEAQNDKTTSLASPKNGIMNQSIKEGLSGIIHIQLFENNNLLYEDTGKHSGLEIMMHVPSV